MVLGSSPEQSTKYYSDNIPDYLVMEQNYLDNYELAYNINRKASTNYEPSKASVNVGINNPSYNLKSEEAFAWNRTHSEDLKAQWSITRGKYTFFVYSSRTFEFLQSFPSAIKLSIYLNTGQDFTYQLLKLIQTSDYSVVIYKDYIVSLTPHDADFLSNNFKLFVVKKESVSKTTKKGIMIYGFNPSSNEYRTWLSKVSCVEDITGKRHSNIRTINQRIDKGILYKGFYLQTKPFDSGAEA